MVTKTTEWLSLHIYYHEDLNRVLMHLVEPTTRDLWTAGLVDRFFYIRHGLGGPHIRWRLRPCPGAEDGVEKRIRQDVDSFLESYPSVRILLKEHLKATTRQIAAEDPNEEDEEVYEDNTWRWIAFRPETDRYGGLDLLRHSLDFFTLSSAEALRIVRMIGSKPRSHQLTIALRLLVRQALGHAAHIDELDALTTYTPKEWSERWGSASEKANLVFESQKSVLTQIVFEEVERRIGFDVEKRAKPGTADALFQAANRLARITNNRSIASSQMHMTANRLGLHNPEEVYLGVLERLTLREIALSQAQTWAELSERLKIDSARPTTLDSLAELIRPSLDYCFATG